MRKWYFSAEPKIIFNSDDLDIVPRTFNALIFVKIDFKSQVILRLLRLIVKYVKNVREFVTK